MTEFEKVTKFEKKLFAMIWLLQEAIEYGMKNPNSDIGRLIRVG